MLEFNYEHAAKVFDKYVGVATDEVTFPKGALRSSSYSHTFVIGKGFFFTKPAGPYHEPKGGIGSWDRVLQC